MYLIPNMNYDNDPCRTIIQDTDNFCHECVAKLILMAHPNQFKCGSIKHNIWYQFINHRWIEIDSAYVLRNYISTELIEVYEKYREKLYDSAKALHGDAKSECIDKISKICKIIKQLSNASFKNGVIKACCNLVYDADFLHNLDENKNLICFNNGVYDLEADTFRDGKPQDNITLCAGYSYIKHNRNSQHHDNIITFLSNIQPDVEIRKYMMSVLASCLTGSANDGKLYIFNGSNATIMSKLMELMKYTLGDLVKHMDTIDLIPRQASTRDLFAKPDLFSKKGVRICIFDKEDAFICSAMIKSEFIPFLLCNELPTITKVHNIPEIKVIPFPDIDDLPCSLTKEIPEWGPTFMSMLISWKEKHHINSALVIPDLVLQSTLACFVNCNIFKEFIDHCLKNTGNLRNSINITNLHKLMKDWFKEIHNDKCPTINKLRRHIANTMSESYSMKYDILTGYKIKTIKHLK